jgi:hypothetical protein
MFLDFGSSDCSRKFAGNCGTESTPTGCTALSKSEAARSGTALPHGSVSQSAVGSYGRGRNFTTSGPLSYGAMGEAEETDYIR